MLCSRVYLRTSRICRSYSFQICPHPPSFNPSGSIPKISSVYQAVIKSIFLTLRTLPIDPNNLRSQCKGSPDLLLLREIDTLRLLQRVEASKLSNSDLLPSDYKELLQRELYNEALDAALSIQKREIKSDALAILFEGYLKKNEFDLAFRTVQLDPFILQESQSLARIIEKCIDQLLFDKALHFAAFATEDTTTTNLYQKITYKLIEINKPDELRIAFDAAKRIPSHAVREEALGQIAEKFLTLCLYQDSARAAKAMSFDIAKKDILKRIKKQKPANCSVM